MDKSEKIFAAVDIGSTKVVALAARKNEDGRIQVIGLGHSPSRGVKRGVVFNVEEAFAAISDAVGQAERVSGHDIENVYVNISGQQLTTLTSHQQRTLGREQTVSEYDIVQMMEQARKMDLPDEMTVYHINPEFYTIGDEQLNTNAVGAIGEKIEGTFKVHIAPDAYQKNIAMCFDRGSIRVQKAILDPIASAEVVLSDDEKEAGVALVDIGGGTTKISIFCEGVLCFTSMIPFGGNVVTKDIKEGCSITLKDAEAMKKKFGQAIGDFAPENKVVSISIEGWEPKQISFKNLAHIIQARMDEIIGQIFLQIRKSGYVEKLGAGIVITGGTSLLPNLSQLVKFHTGFDVRVGRPNIHAFIVVKELDDPKFSTVLGLLKLASEDDGPTGKRRWGSRKPKSNDPGIIKTMQTKFVQGVIGFFEDVPPDTEMT